MALDDADPAALMAMVAAQTITADYLEVNIDAIELTDGDMILPTTFTVCEGDTVEFHLAMTDEPGLTDNPFVESMTNEGTVVTLLANDEEVAVSSTLDVDGNNDGGAAGYRHTLFYKNTASMETEYKIQITAVGTETDDMLAMI